MLQKSSRFDMRFLLLFIIIAYSIAPIVSRFISAYLTTYAYLVIIVFALILIVLGKSNVSINKYLPLLFPFILYQLLVYLSGNNSIILWAYSMLLFMLPIAIGYFVLCDEQQFLTGIVKTIIVIFTITLITTVIGLIRFPGASRVLATIESSQNAEAILYNWNNIGGYEFVYMSVLLYPLIILAYKQRKMPLWLAVVFAVVIGTVIFLSEYTVALLLFLVTTITFFLKRNMNVNGLMIFAFFGVLFVVIFSDLVSDFLMWLADVTNSTFFKERLTALAGGREGLENSESNRIFLYQRSLETFIKSPLFGSLLNGGGGVGGHSQILDALGQYGIIGGIILVFMYKTIYTNFIKPFRNEYGYGYVLWFFIQAIFLSTINTGFWFEVLALFGPLILYVIYHKKEQKQ